MENTFYLPMFLAFVVFLTFPLETHQQIDPCEDWSIDTLSSSSKLHNEDILIFRDKYFYSYNIDASKLSKPYSISSYWGELETPITGAAICNVEGNDLMVFAKSKRIWYYNTTNATLPLWEVREEMVQSSPVVFTQEHDIHALACPENNKVWLTTKDISISCSFGNYGFKPCIKHEPHPVFKGSTGIALASFRGEPIIAVASDIKLSYLSYSGPQQESERLLRTIDVWSEVFHCRNWPLTFAIIAVAAGIVVILLLFIIVCGFVCCRRKKRVQSKKRSKETTSSRSLLFRGSKLSLTPSKTSMSTDKSKASKSTIASKSYVKLMKKK